MEEKDNDEISKQEMDLTEDEMQRIFFGSDKALPATPSIPLNKPKKLDRENKPITSSVIPPSLETIEESEENNESETKEVTRPQGRPKVWTEEKIAQKKLENAKLAEQRKKERLEKIRASKLSIQQPITNHDREKIIEATIASKDTVEKYITQKKAQLRSIQKKNNIEFVRQKDKCPNHLFKFQFFDAYGNVVVACSRCSTQDQMTTTAWNSYLIKHKGKI